MIRRKHISLSLSDSKLETGNPELALLLRISSILTASMRLKPLLKKVLSEVMIFFESEAGRAYLAEDDCQELRLIAFKGIDAEGLTRVKVGEGFSGKAVQTKSFIAQHVSELQDKKRARLLLSKGLKVVICVPLIVGDRVSGVINLATSKTFELDQRKIDLLIAIGNQIAIAVNSAKLYEDLENKIRMLEEKEMTIKTFAYSVSHDLKSPTVAIYGLARRLNEKYDDVLDRKGKGYCEQIMKAAKDVMTLVEQINSYIATKEVPLNFEKVSVKEILEAIKEEFSDQFEERFIRWSEPNLLPEIVADRLALLRVFRNLVDNALKHGGDRLSGISMDYEENDGFHVFSISDDGPGLGMEERDRIFERYQRRNGNKGIPGSGLGLAIVKEAAEKHHGSTWFESEYQKGTTFYVSISKDLGVAENS